MNDEYMMYDNIHMSVWQHWPEEQNELKIRMHLIFRSAIIFFRGFVRDCIYNYYFLLTFLFTYNHEHLAGHRLC